MQFALVNGQRVEPSKGLKGICIGCGNEVVAKCGSVKVHHWAHKHIQDCDSWWEPETEWHRNWKNQFPAEYREIVFNDPKNGEVHRADIHTKGGVTIEFQNSPISTEELKSREEFYSKLIWVINGEKFIKNFEFTRHIPNPNDPILNDFEIDGLIYFKKADLINNPGGMHLVYGMNAPELKNLTISVDHLAFDWKYKHSAWFSSTVPIFLDFNKNFLYWLRKREQVHEPYWYIQQVKKSDFIAKYST